MRCENSELDIFALETERVLELLADGQPYADAGRKEGVLKATVARLQAQYYRAATALNQAHGKVVEAHAKLAWARCLGDRIMIAKATALLALADAHEHLSALKTSRLADSVAQAQAAMKAAH
ncbi:hypothetical protein [Chitinolyticbacter meiyuanensis]|uniref:hypothetical protein n=1 Tax=Chitinolyticbacter meiyuanensis TaxID=682798 RepID=UPI0011E58E64|nr:hypothetical protein [Chitinolyticbacter meiyuanensis]